MLCSICKQREAVVRHTCRLCRIRELTNHVLSSGKGGGAIEVAQDAQDDAIPSFPQDQRDDDYRAAVVGRARHPHWHQVRPDMGFRDLRWLRWPDTLG